MEPKERKKNEPKWLNRIQLVKRGWKALNGFKVIVVARGVMRLNVPEKWVLARRELPQQASSWVTLARRFGVDALISVDFWCDDAQEMMLVGGGGGAQALRCIAASCKGVMLSG